MTVKMRSAVNDRERLKHMRSHLFAVPMAAAIVLGTFVGCGGCGDGGDQTGDGGTLPDGGSPNNSNDSGMSNDGGPTPVVVDGGGLCYPALCGTQSYQCGNCADDDSDGLIDSRDPDCLGPCHNDESSFDIGIQAAKGGNCDSLECYYDTNAGRGNDNCWSSFRCDPLDPYADLCDTDLTCGNTAGWACGADPAQCPATQTNVCYTACQAITPNGCDCFGCCTVTLPGGTSTVDIFLGSEDSDATTLPCTLANANNRDACRLCTKNVSCGNVCGRCQLCLGKTELPADCFDGGTAPPPELQCPGGQQPCGLAGQAECPGGFFCLTGCCIQVIN